MFFFVVKGPAANATDAPQHWGLLCKPVMKMNNFLFFLIMEHLWNETDRGKTEVLGQKPVPVPLYPPQIPHGLTQDRNRASTVRRRRLTAWAVARPNSSVLLIDASYFDDVSFSILGGTVLTASIKSNSSCKQVLGSVYSLQHEINTTKCPPNTQY